MTSGVDDETGCALFVSLRGCPFVCLEGFRVSATSLFFYARRFRVDGSSGSLIISIVFLQPFHSHSVHCGAARE